MKIILNIFKFFILVGALYLSSYSSPAIEYKINNTNLNSTGNLSTMAMKITEFEYNDLYSAKDTLTGELTGYVYNCPACNGHLGCLSSYDITNGITTYNDSTYGTVSIVASSGKLKCGSIVRFSTNRISSEPVFAIVLDRGVLGNDLDYLSPNLQYALTLGRSSITYDVLRSGW